MQARAKRRRSSKQLRTISETSEALDRTLGVNRIFSQVPPLRPPTDQENKKIAKLKVLMGRSRASTTRIPCVALRNCHNYSNTRYSC